MDRSEHWICSLRLLVYPTTNAKGSKQHNQYPGEAFDLFLRYCKRNMY